MSTSIPEVAIVTDCIREEKRKKDEASTSKVVTITINLFIVRKI